MYREARYLPSGDCALIMELGNEINPEINRRIREICYLIEKEEIEGVVEWVPTYRSIMIVYNPLVIEYSRLVNRLKGIEKESGEASFPPPLVIEIPTVYGGEFGPDIEYVASYNGLNVEDVINIHSSTNYLIYMLGFTPGFPYLGGMSSKIATPRLETPRERIPGGSVGIAGNQTGIYPIESPGGWRLIGRTPLKLFDTRREEPVLLKPGNYLRFKPITREEYGEIREQVEAGTYSVRSYPLEESDNNGS